MNTLTGIFETMALGSLEKQNDLMRRIGEHFVELDLETGIARFNDGITLPFQLLGTESDNSLTWLWAWSEEQPEVADVLLRSARELKAWGVREGVPEFTIPSIDLNRADGMMLSLIASEISAASGYYRDQYDGGTLFLLLFGANNDRGPDFDRAGLVSAMRDLVSRYDFNHRHSLLSYFSKKSLPFSESGDTLNAELAGGDRLIALFDQAGKVVEMNGEPLS